MGGIYRRGGTSCIIGCQIASNTFASEHHEIIEVHGIHSKDSVHARRGQPLPIRAPSHAANGSAVAGQAQQFLPRTRVPQLRGLILATCVSRFPSGRKLLSIGGGL